MFITITILLVRIIIIIIIINTILIVFLFVSLSLSLVYPCYRSCDSHYPSYLWFVFLECMTRCREKTFGESVVLVAARLIHTNGMWPFLHPNSCVVGREVQVCAYPVLMESIIPIILLVNHWLNPHHPHPHPPPHQHHHHHHHHHHHPPPPPCQHHRQCCVIIMIFLLSSGFFCISFLFVSGLRQIVGKTLQKGE